MTRDRNACRFASFFLHDRVNNKKRVSWINTSAYRTSLNDNNFRRPFIRVAKFERQIKKKEKGGRNPVRVISVKWDRLFFSRDCWVWRKKKKGQSVTKWSGSGHRIPAIITVAGNADLHRERQPAIKVHGFHGESQHLFLSFLVMFFFAVLALMLRDCSPVEFFFHFKYRFDKVASVSGQCQWNQLATDASLPLQLSSYAGKTISWALWHFLLIKLLDFLNFRIIFIIYYLNSIIILII